MLFKDLKPGQKFKFKFDEDQNFIYKKLDDFYLQEVSIPPAYGVGNRTFSIDEGALSTREVIEV
jgi:hypothetical protein